MNYAGILFLLTCLGLVVTNIYRSRDMNIAILIVVDESRIVKHAGLSQHALNQLQEFFQQDVECGTEFSIRGHRDRDGHVRYQFKGEIPTGTQQQIRNYLHTIIPPAKPKSRGDECA